MFFLVVYLYIWFKIYTLLDGYFCSTKGAKDGVFSKLDLFIILLLTHPHIYLQLLFATVVTVQVQWLKDWSWLDLNLLKSLLQVVEESILCFQHLLDRRLVFNVSLRDVRLNLLGSDTKVVAFVVSRPSDNASHHRVEALALVRQLFQLSSLPPDHLGAQTLPAFSTVSKSIGQRVTLCQFCWCGRSDGGRLAAGRGQVLGEGSLQAKRHTQLLHRRCRHVFIENGCYGRRRLHLCGWEGERWRLRARAKGRLPYISSSLSLSLEPFVSQSWPYQSWSFEVLCWIMKIPFMFQ